MGRHFARLVGLDFVAFRAFRAWLTIVHRLRKAPRATGPDHFPQWLWLIRGLENRAYLRSWIERRFVGGPKIVVLGMGSIGDVLQITPLLRALKNSLPTAEIVLLHHSRIAETVLHGNPNVASIALADARQFDQVKKAVREEGAADLVVEVASTVFVVTYTAAPSALRHPRLGAVFSEAFFASATAAQVRHNGQLAARPAGEFKLLTAGECMQQHYLDVIGTTSNLPIDRYSSLDFVCDADAAAAFEFFRSHQPYVTVQNGVDKDVANWSRAMGRRPTKLLPEVIWHETVRLLQAADLAVVQLGAEQDEPIAGVDLDLRGRTSLREAAAILKRAVCLIGVEGGLVHLARAMEVRSVVAFGPTSAAFLGYPQNVNLVPSGCHSCWWATSDWYMNCPRGFKEPPCMQAFTPAMLARAALEIVDGRKQQSGRRTSG